MAKCPLVDIRLHIRATMYVFPLGHLAFALFGLKPFGLEDSG